MLIERPLILKSEEILKSVRILAEVRNVFSAFMELQGHASWENQAPGAIEFEFLPACRGRFLEILPERKIKLALQHTHEVRIGEPRISVATIEFIANPVEAATMLRIHHEPLSESEALLIGRHWDHLMARLKLHSEKAN